MAEISASSQGFHPFKYSDLFNAILYNLHLTKTSLSWPKLKWETSVFLPKSPWPWLYQKFRFDRNLRASAKKLSLVGQNIRNIAIWSWSVVTHGCWWSSYQAMLLLQHNRAVLLIGWKISVLKCCFLENNNFAFLSVWTLHFFLSELFYLRIAQKSDRETDRPTNLQTDIVT